MAAARRARRRLQNEMEEEDREFLPAPRKFVDRSNPLEDMSPQKIKVAFRLSAATIYYLCDLLCDVLARPTARGHALPVVYTVCIGLSYMATGGFMSLVGRQYFFGVHKATVCRAQWEFVAAMRRHLPRFVTFPTDQAAQAVKTAFMAVAGFPGVLGIVDGTQIEIQAPFEREEIYVCRHMYHSINVQIICDNNYMITSFKAAAVGSVHDSIVFEQSAIKQQFQQGVHQGLLIGDSGYKLHPYLMIPFRNPATQPQMNYNTSLCKTRVRIEQTIGILKRRFAIIGGRVRLEPRKVCNVVQTCIVLHNIAHLQNDNFDDDFLDPVPVVPNQQPLQQHQEDPVAGVNTRNAIVANVFS